MDELRVFVVGDCRSQEFRDPLAQLHASAELTSVVDLAGAVSLVTRGVVLPDLVVLAQQFPRQFDAAGVEQLRHKVPTAHFVSLLGSWCEGEERTGEPLPGVQRIYWNRFAAWWAAQRRLLTAGLCPDWGQPVTSAEDDRRLATLRNEAPLPRVCESSPPTIAVAATQREMADWLCEACRVWGYGAVGLNPREHLPQMPVAAVIWDCRDAEDLTELKRLRRHFTDVPLVAVANFPRWQQRERLINEGVAGLLSKPLRIDELQAVLQPLLKNHVAERLASPLGRVA